jgi:cation diffusion facilitator CzcD-associated flavoprotein CzcO/acetyl esterase/lipase
MSNPNLASSDLATKTGLPAPDVDVVVIGAGFAGLYATHKFRNLLGLRVMSFEASAGPGGVWNWNRYPGARCDFESVWYSFSFDEDLQREWRWSERFSAQPEILSYLEHVADRFDLRRSFKFDTRVTSAVWDEANSWWKVETDGGDSVSTRFLVSGVGGMSAPKRDDFPGAETFTGELYRTSSWPHEPVSFAGKRVAVIGTGSTGVQVIGAIAKEVDSLTVFQRTANYATPLGNRPTRTEELDEIIANYPSYREQCRNNFLGAPYPPAEPSAVAASPDERRAMYDKYYDGGAFRLLMSTYGDLIFSRTANDTLTDYIRDRIRERVKDPKTAELLCPDDHAYATKRSLFETNYYEAYNQDNVELVSVRNNPIVEITPKGLRTTEAEYDFDAIVLATGFDAWSGALERLGLVGRGGVSLSEYWSEGARTYLGIAVPKFPNFFALTGPQSATPLYNNPLAIEDHIDFTGAAIQRLIEEGARTFEASEEATDTYMDLSNGIANLTLVPQTEGTSYMGGNIPGKPRVALFFAGGAPLYRAIFSDVERTDFGGFQLDGEARPSPPLIDLDPAVASLWGAMLSMEPRSFDQLSLEEQRALVETYTQLQPPPDPSVTMTETTYQAADGSERRVRVYVPPGDGPFPVAVFYHPGGWSLGSIDMARSPATALAAALKAVIVSPSYRLAPENPYPAGLDDSYEAFLWTAEHAQEHGGDPSRLFVMGESAGGYLATMVAHRARDKQGPQIAAQLLFYPPIAPDADTPSRRRYVDGPPLNLAALAQMWDLYLPNEADRVSPAAVPSRADLTGLPPTLLISLEVDPLRDEAEEYAASLQAAGVITEQVRLPGLIHATLNLGAFVPRWTELIDAAKEFAEKHVALTLTR